MCVCVCEFSAEFVSRDIVADYTAATIFRIFFPPVFQKPEGDGTDTYLLKPHKQLVVCFVNFIYSSSQCD